MELVKPWEFMEIQDGDSITFRVLRYELGAVTIVARHDGLTREIPALRIFVRPGDKRVGLPYWDITSARLQAQILPWLDNPATRHKVFTVTAHGVRPVKVFQLEAA